MKQTCLCAVYVLRIIIHIRSSCSGNVTPVIMITSMLSLHDRCLCSHNGLKMITAVLLIACSTCKGSVPKFTMICLSSTAVGSVVGRVCQPTLSDGKETGVLEPVNKSDHLKKETPVTFQGNQNKIELLILIVGPYGTQSSILLPKGLKNWTFTNDDCER